jgi:hypothetical protein|tara:strand:+ start:80 stop:535 length:456 start_codon:yes stop_codon:yes gene_type:complete
MGKYLNVDVSGVQTPLKISDVATIVVNAAGTTTTITYDNGGTSVLAIAAASATSRPPSTAGQRAAWVRGLWQQVIAGVAQPWNMPMVPGESEVWDFSASPAAPVASQYVQQGALSTQASTSTLGTKSSAQLLGTGTGAGALGIVGPIVSIT